MTECAGKSILDAQMILLSKPWYVLSTEDPLGIELCPSDRTMRFELSRKLDKVDRLILTDRSIISLQWVRPDKEPWAQSVRLNFLCWCEEKRIFGCGEY